MQTWAQRLSAALEKMQLARYGRTLGCAFLRACSSLQRRPLMTVLTVGLMTAALVLVGIAHLAERNARAVGREWGAGVQMVVYLDEGISRDHARQLSQALEASPLVQNVVYVPPEQAMQHLLASLGPHDELINGLEASFLPASLEVRLQEGVRNLVSAGPVMESLQATSGVEDVEFLGSWVDHLAALLAQVQRAGIWLVVIASLVGIFTMIATMRLSADSRAAELRVLHILGAPAVLSYGPNLMEGAMIGLVGAVCAVVGLFAFFDIGAPLIVSALSTSLGAIELHFLSVEDMVQLAFFGMCVGAVGGLVTNVSLGKV